MYYCTKKEFLRWKNHDKYVPLLFNVGYEQTVYTKYLKINVQLVSIKHKVFLRLD